MFHLSNDHFRPSINARPLKDVTTWGKGLFSLRSEDKVNCTRREKQCLPWRKDDIPPFSFGVSEWVRDLCLLLLLAWVGHPTEADMPFLDRDPGRVAIAARIGRCIIASLGKTRPVRNVTLYIPILSGCCYPFGTLAH